MTKAFSGDWSGKNWRACPRPRVTYLCPFLLRSYFIASLQTVYLLFPGTKCRRNEGKKRGGTGTLEPSPPLAPGLPPHTLTVGPEEWRGGLLSSPNLEFSKVLLKRYCLALAGAVQWLCAGLQIKETLVQFLVRARAWVAGQVPSWGHARDATTL